MHRTERRKMRDIGLVLAGIGIGSAVGLLLAPASGEETRSNLASKARDIRDRVSSRAAAAAGE